MYGNGNEIKVNGATKTYMEVRQQAYENIIDETLFIARASEGAVSAEWVMDQCVFNNCPENSLKNRLLVDISDY